MGCSDSLNLNPCAGWSSTGADIETPAIGPATVGAVGEELLEVWQPASASRSRPHVMVDARDVMGNLDYTNDGRRVRTCKDVQMNLSAAYAVNFRERRAAGDCPRSGYHGATEVGYPSAERKQHDQGRAHERDEQRRLQRQPQAREVEPEGRFADAEP